MTPTRNPLHALACLLPLLPVLIAPGLGVLGSLLLVGIALWTMPSSRGPSLAMVWRSWPVSLLLGVAVGAALSVTIAEVVRPMVEGASGRNVDVGDLEQAAGNPAIFGVTLVVALLSAAAEELIFRGFVIGWGAAVLGRRLAPALVIVSAAVFGFAHLAYGLAGIVTTGFAGLVLGALYLATGRRLLPAIAAHAAFNLIGSIALYLA